MKVLAAVDIQDGALVTPIDHPLIAFYGFQHLPPDLEAQDGQRLSESLGQHDDVEIEVLRRAWLGDHAVG